MNRGLIEFIKEADGLIYLASPYSSSSAIVREDRFDAVCVAAANLMRAGLLIFSPIAHTHPIALCGLPKGWEFWEKYDRQFLEACSGMIVLTLDGWQASKGIRAEVDIMTNARKVVAYMDASDTREAACLFVK